jgi:hypothetical protein
MLSYLYQITRNFERQHGYAPNLLYLNPDQFSQLQSDLADIPHLEGLTLFLGMELVLSKDCQHPKVAWSAMEWQRAIAV